ncbi:MAG: DNA primase [Pseudomonadota bacterium]
MRFPDSFLDDIRDRLRISEVIGQRLTFDKKKTNAAKGDYWACCPFHGEKTPSFHCEDRKGRYYCFGCGASGDHFRFVTELEGVSFAEAVESLAAQAGLPMPVMDRREQEREEKRKTLFDVMELAVNFFITQLHEPGGAAARSYLRGRGLSAEIQKTFGIGFAPDSRNALKQYLAEKGVEAQQMEACGLVNHGEDIPVSYDKFRNRIMFPIPDSRGRVIAFGGRAMNPDALAKYMNSPETELFHKSNVLYNFARARKSAHAQGQIIAAEGYMDVIALHSAGFENAVAPLGTALTERQIALLWRLNSEPVLCFDGDEAGIRAAHRAVDVALPHLAPGRSLQFALLPNGKDPDDLIRENGPDAMRDVLEAALPLSDMVWNREISSGNFETPERRAQLENRLRQVTQTIRDENVRRYYEQSIKEKLGVYFNKPSLQSGRPTPRMGPAEHGQNRFGGRNSSLAQQGSRKFQVSPSLLSSKILKRGSGAMPLREAALVGGLVFHPALCVEFFEEVSTLVFSDQTASDLQSVVLNSFAIWNGEGDFPDRDFLAGEVEKQNLSRQLETVSQQLKANKLWQLLPEAAFEDARDGWHQAFTLHIKNQALNSELKVAERALADDDSQENLERLLQIQQELSRSDGIEALIDGFGVSSGRPAKGF